MANDILVPKRRGRPPKALKAQQEAAKSKPVLSDAEVLSLVQSRFAVLRRLAIGCSTGDTRAVIVSGAPGIGKSYNCIEVLEDIALKRGNENGKTFEAVSGFMSPVHLYMALYRNRAPGQVLLLDDCDSVYGVDEALNILKAALDTKKARTISWFADSAVLKSEDIPNQFLFEGSVIFITNLDFDGFLAAGKNRLTPHIDALVSRSLYLDLKLHESRSVMLWIEHVVTSLNILVSDFGITKEQQSEVIAFLKSHTHRARKLSVRTAVLIGGMVKSNPDSWKLDAELLLMRD